MVLSRFLVRLTNPNSESAKERGHLRVLKRAIDPADKLVG